MSHRSVDPRLAARLSVKKAGGIGLAGMAGWGANANSGVVAAPSLKKLLRVAAQNLGCVRINVEGTSLVGSAIRVTNLKTWGDKLDSLAHHMQENQPVYFALYKTEKECVIVTYVPDFAKPQTKMIYASSKNAVKDAILDTNDGCDLEEFNVDEINELSFANYERKQQAPKPYTEQELLRQEQDQAETAGAYGTIAQIIKMEQAKKGNRDMLSGDKNARPIALPGMGAGMGDILSRAKLRPTGARTKSNKDDPPHPAKMAPLKIQVLPTPPKPEPMVTPKSSDDQAEVEPVKTETAPAALAEEMDLLMAPTEKAIKLKDAEEDLGVSIVIRAAAPMFAEQEEVEDKEEAEEEKEDKAEEKDQSEEVEDEKLSLRSLRMQEEEEKDLQEVTEQEVSTHQPEPTNAFDDDAFLSKVPMPETKVPPAMDERDFQHNQAGEHFAHIEKLDRKPSSASGIIETASRLGRHLGRAPRQGSKRVLGGFQRLAGSVLGGFSKRPRATMTEDVLATLDSNNGQSTYSELLEMIQGGEYGEKDPKMLDQYLSDQEFARVFNMPRESFETLPGWKKDKLRRKVRLL